MLLKEEPSKRKRGKFLIHVENQTKFGVDIEFRYKKGYPCKRPLMRILNSKYVEKGEADSLMLAVTRLGEELAEHNAKFPDQKEGMVFKLVQEARDKLDELAMSKRQLFPRDTPKPPSLPLSDTRKDTEKLLSEFAERLKAEIERQQVPPSNMLLARAAIEGSVFAIFRPDGGPGPATIQERGVHIAFEVPK